MRAETVGDKLGDAKAAALVETLAYMPAEVYTETLGATMSDLEAQALVDTVFHT